MVVATTGCSSTYLPLSIRRIDVSDYASILEEITTIFSEELNLTIDSKDTDLFESGAMDSLSLVELLFQIEQRFGIEISIDSLEIDNFHSIDTIAKFVLSSNGLLSDG